MNRTLILTILRPKYGGLYIKWSSSYPGFFARLAVLQTNVRDPFPRVCLLVHLNACDALERETEDFCVFPGAYQHFTVCGISSNYVQVGCAQ